MQIRVLGCLIIEEEKVGECNLCFLKKLTIKSHIELSTDRDREQKPSKKRSTLFLSRNFMNLQFYCLDKIAPHNNKIRVFKTMQTAPKNVNISLTLMSNPSDYRRKLVKKIKKIVIAAKDQYSSHPHISDL